MTKTQKVLAGCAAALALLAAGAADKQDATRAQAHYCAMVRGGYWPDFRHTYRAECKPLGYGVPRKSLYSNER